MKKYFRTSIRDAETTKHYEKLHFNIEKLPQCTSQSECYVCSSDWRLSNTGNPLIGLCARVAFPYSIRAVSFTWSIQTENFFQNLIKSNRNKIVFTIFQLTLNQTDVRLVPNESESGNYNLISVWFYKISLCVYLDTETLFFSPWTFFSNKSLVAKTLIRPFYM